MTTHSAQHEVPDPLVETGGRVLDVAEAMAQIEKGQQLAGHFPDADALGRARRVLTGEITADEAYAELDALYRTE